MFLGEDAGGEGGFIVGVEDGDGALEDDDPVVEFFVDEVDGAAGDFRSIVEGLALGVEAGKSGQQGGVDVEDAVGEGADEFGGEQAHVTGEAYEVDVVVAEGGYDFGVVFGAGAAFGFDYFGGNVSGVGGGGAWGFGAVRYNDGDFGVRDFAGSYPVGYRDEVRATA